MERKVKKSNPAQIAIDGAAYFIVIVSVLYVAYSSMGSGPGVAKEQVKVNPGWAAHTEVHQKPKPKSSWSLFADPAEVPQKTAEKQNSGAATWQFFGAEEEVQSTEQAKPVSETAIVSEVEEPVQTEQVFVEDQEEEVEVAPPVKRRVAAKATQPETENYWTLFAPDPAEDAVPRQKKQTPTFSFFAGPDEAEEVDSGKASEIIEKATEAFWDMFQVDKNLEKPFYKPSESVKSTKSKSRKDPNLMNHRSQESQQYVAQEEPLEPLDIPSNEVDESDNESNEHSSFFAEPDVQEKPVHNLQRDQNIDHDLFSSENMALFKKMLAFKNQDALPKIAENQGSWFAAEEPSKKQDSAIRKPSVQKSKYKQEQAWDQFFVEDIEESWLADETRPRKPQAPKNPSQNPSFSAPVPSKKVPSGGSSWFVEESEDSWLANKEQRVPKNPVVNQNPHISSAKPYQPKPAPMDNSIFVEDMEDSWLAEPKRQTEKTQDPKNDGTLKSASLKDLLTTGIYFSEPGVKPQNDQAKKQAFSKSPQVKTTKASSASDELFDSATIKKAYRFFDGFFKTEESSPVKERIQNIFVAEATQDAQAIYGNSEKEQKLSKKKVKTKSYELLLKRLKNLVIAYKTLNQMHDPTLTDVETTLLEVMLENSEEGANKFRSLNQGSPEVKDTEEARNYKAETQPQQKKRFKEDSILVEDMDESWLAEPVVKMQPPPKQAPQPSFKKPVQERSQYDGDSIFVEELEDSWIATPMTKKPAHSSKQAPQPSFSKPTQHRKQPVGESWLVEDIDDVWLAEYPRQKRPQGQQVNGAKQNVHKQPIKQAEPKRVNQKQKASFDKLFADEEVSGVLADGKDHKKVGADWNFKPKVYKSKKIESKRNVLSEVVDSAFDALRATGVRVPILDSIKPKVYRPSNVKEKQREAAATKENAYKALKSLINSIF